MWTRFLAFLLILWSTFLLVVFLFPDMADRYGDAHLNSQIREFKEQLFRMTAPE